jgi:hypothetical protein
MSALKIQGTDYAALRDAFVRGSALIPPVAEYLGAGMTARRHAWDALHAAKFSGYRDIYRYANDSHIDSALRQIMKEQS